MAKAKRALPVPRSRILDKKHPKVTSRKTRRKVKYETAKPNKYGWGAGVRKVFKGE